MQHTARYTQAKKITLIGAAANVGLGLIKLIGGFFFHSHALIADGFHSFSDLITDATVLFASKYGSQDADDTHPYGHQRIETAATLGLALLLILTGAGIAWDSVDEIIHKKHDVPEVFSIPIAGFSILINELLFYATRRVGKRIQSDLILANAWHHRSDAAASLIVLLGLIGSLAGFRFLDPMAAVVIGCMIIKMGFDYGWNSVKELIDTAVEPEKLATIERLIMNIDGVQKIHQLRTRMMGQDTYIDVHIQVSPFISVSEGHFIAQHVHAALVKQVDGVKDVTVHVDPEDDELSSPSLHLPNRKTLEQLFIDKWSSDYPGIQSSQIHYIGGQITIDLLCDPIIVQSKSLQHRIQNDLLEHAFQIRIRLMIHKDTE